MFSFNNKGTIKLLICCLNNFSWNRSPLAEFKSPTIQAMNKKCHCWVHKCQCEEMLVIKIVWEQASYQHTIVPPQKFQKNIAPLFTSTFFLFYGTSKQKSFTHERCLKKSYSKSVLTLVLVLPTTWKEDNPVF